MPNLDDLKELRETVDRVKSDLSVRMGERNAVMDRVKSEFGLDSVEDIETRLEEIRNQLGPARQKREELVEQVEQRLSGYENN